jgi:hypothetical protein
MKSFKTTAIVTFLLSSCLIDVNTSDPLASESISASKKNGLFIKQYLPAAILPCTPKEAWIEYSWKNEVKGCTVYKQKFEKYYQLVFNIDLKKLGLDRKDYLVDWKLVEDSLGTVGMFNGMYVLFLKSKPLPPVFRIDAYRNDSLYKECEIALMPQL